MGVHSAEPPPRSNGSRFNGLAPARPCQRESAALFIAWLDACFCEEGCEGGRGGGGLALSLMSPHTHKVRKVSHSAPAFYFGFTTHGDMSAGSEDQNGTNQISKSEPVRLDYSLLESRQFWPRRRTPGHNLIKYASDSVSVLIYGRYLIFPRGGKKRTSR